MPPARLLTISRYLVLISICILLLSPLLGFLMNAFAFRWFYPQFIPQEITIQAWQDLFDSNSKLPEALFNSALIAILVTASSLIIGLPAARALGLYQFPGKTLIEFLILAPTIMPPLAVAIGLNINILQWGLAGSILGVSLVHLVPVMPYVVLTLAGVYANYNPEYEEQARTLGANTMHVWTQVTLPAIFPGMVVAALFAFLVSWSQYILTLLIGSGRIITLPILLFSTASGGNHANTAAMSLVFIAPALLILMLTSRYLTGQSAALGGIAKA